MTVHITHTTGTNVLGLQARLCTIFAKAARGKSQAHWGLIEGRYNPSSYELDFV